MNILKAIGLFIAFIALLLVVGTFGWQIILGTISLVILVIAYIVIRIIVEYPSDEP